MWLGTENQKEPHGKALNLCRLLWLPFGPGNTTAATLCFGDPHTEKVGLLDQSWPRSCKMLLRCFCSHHIFVFITQRVIGSFELKRTSGVSQSNLLPKAGSPSRSDQLSQGFVQSGLENLHEWRLCWCLSLFRCWKMISSLVDTHVYWVWSCYSKEPVLGNSEILKWSVWGCNYKSIE